MEGKRIKDAKEVTMKQLIWGCPLPPRGLYVFAMGNFTSTRFLTGLAVVQKRSQLQCPHFQNRLLPFSYRSLKVSGKQISQNRVSNIHSVSGQTGES